VPELTLTPQRNEGAQPFVAQVESAPNQHGEIDREQNVAEERTSHAHMRGDSAAKIAGQQNRAENGRARNHIEDGAREKDDAKAEKDAFGISELNCSLDDRRGFHQFPDSVHDQEQRRQGAHDASGPESPLGERSGLSI
jgi:hypothetical protein